MKRERGLVFLVPEGRFSGGQEGDSWWDENKQVNPYKACIYGLCRDFLDGVGYDLGTKIYFNEDNAFWAKSIPF